MSHDDPFENKASCGAAEYDVCGTDDGPIFCLVPFFIIHPSTGPLLWVVFWVWWWKILYVAP